jgi:hypothetical protein
MGSHRNAELAHYAGTAHLLPTGNKGRPSPHEGGAPAARPSANVAAGVRSEAEAGAVGPDQIVS